MTRDEFERRAFFTVAEIVRATRPGPPTERTIRRWLHSAALVEENAAGAKVVTKERLSCCLPFLLEAVRRKLVGT